MPAVQLFERLAGETWTLLSDAHRSAISMGETTLTDINLLRIKAARLPNVRVYKAVGRDEPDKGFDWEWWIGSHANGWWRYSVQAKKLELKRGIYADLRHQTASGFQIDILDDFARAQQSIPLYCFYNHATSAEAQGCWHCHQPFDAAQLGCSLVPLDVVRDYHDNRVRKSFANLHEHHSAVPWRCILDCFGRVPAFPLGEHPLAEDRDVAAVMELPPFLLAEQAEADVGAEVPVQGNSLYDAGRGGYPKRLMVVDLGAEE